MGSVRYEIGEGARSEGTRLIYVSESRSDNSWNSVLHSHANAELFYFVRGEGVLRIRDEDISVRADELVLVNPHVEHTERAVPGKVLEYIVLGISDIEFLSPDGRGTRFLSLNCAEFRRELLPYFVDMVAEAGSGREDSVDVCASILSILFIKTRRRGAFGLAPVTDGHISGQCAEVKRYIDDHFFENLDLDLLADRVHRSRFYLSRSFREEYGVSPMRYLTERRVREAKYLLEHTDHPLTEISAFVGFSSPSYFAQRFRKQVGVSPAAYRKSSGKSERNP